MITAFPIAMFASGGVLPDPPTGFTATPLSTNASGRPATRFDWSYGADPDSFIIAWAGGVDGPFTDLVTVPGNVRTYTDPDGGGGAYSNTDSIYWYVYAVVSMIESGPSNADSLAAVAGTFSSPIVISSTEIDVVSSGASAPCTWIASTDGGSTFQTFAETSGSLNATGLTPGVLYAFEVASNARFFSTFNAANSFATTKVAAPTSFAAVYDFDADDTTGTWGAPEMGTAPDSYVADVGTNPPTTAHMSGDVIGVGSGSSGLTCYVAGVLNGITGEVASTVST